MGRPRVWRWSGPPRSAPVAFASTPVSREADPRARGAGTPRPGISAPKPWHRVTAVTSARWDGHKCQPNAEHRSNAFDDGTKPVPEAVGKPTISSTPRERGRSVSWIRQRPGSCRDSCSSGAEPSRPRGRACPTGGTGGGTLRPAVGFPSCRHEREAPSGERRRRTDQLPGRRRPFRRIDSTWSRPTPSPVTKARRAVVRRVAVTELSKFRMGPAVKPDDTRRDTSWRRCRWIGNPVN